MKWFLISPQYHLPVLIPAFYGELPQRNRLRIPQGRRGPDMRDLRFATTGRVCRIILFFPFRKKGKKLNLPAEDLWDGRIRLSACRNKECLALCQGKWGVSKSALICKGLKLKSFSITVGLQAFPLNRGEKLQGAAVRWVFRRCLHVAVISSIYGR